AWANALTRGCDRRARGTTPSEWIFISRRTAVRDPGPSARSGRVARVVDPVSEHCRHLSFLQPCIERRGIDALLYQRRKPGQVRLSELRISSRLLDQLARAGSSLRLQPHAPWAGHLHRAATEAGARGLQ